MLAWSGDPPAVVRPEFRRRSARMSRCRPARHGEQNSDQWVTRTPETGTTCRWRVILKTASGAPQPGRAGSHAGSHTDERLRGSSNFNGQLTGPAEVTD